MSNGDAPSPAPDNPPPPPSNDGKKPKGCSVALLTFIGDLFGRTTIKWGDKEFSAPLGIALAMVLGCVALYLALMLWAIPKQVHFIIDPLVEPALTALPTKVPRPHLVVKGKAIQNRQICIVPKETVRMEIEPQLGESGAKYIWVPTGTELIETDDWEREFTAPESAGKVLTVQVCEKNLDTGACDQSIDFMIFTVQEVCPK